MKIFSIRDESNNNKTLGYLLYYEAEKRFYIELPEDADLWETPLILSSFLKRGQHTINSYWSKIWVQQRIIPSDRQNLGSIIRDNNLSGYDEFELLMLSMGRCAQDSYYLVPLQPEDLPCEIYGRFERRIEDIVPLKHNSLLVFFRDGITRKISLDEYFEKHREFQVFISHPDLFANVKIQVGGYGIYWDDDRAILDSDLYEMGILIPLTASDFTSFATERVINTAEAAEILGCSRQNIDNLTKRGKLHPIKTTGKQTLYLKSEILKRNWE